MWGKGDSFRKYSCSPYNCPCNSNSSGTFIPEWVGSDYYCESGLYSSQLYHDVLFSSDTLWDGEQCNGNEGPCCINPKMPWFMKTLNETTTEDIESNDNLMCEIISFFS